MQLRTSRSPRLNFAHPGQPARVSLAFVVDTLGRVERCGARVTEATPFDAADGVLEQLYRVRFTPGTLNGHKVRTALGLVIETNGEVIRTP